MSVTISVTEEEYKSLRETRELLEQDAGTWALDTIMSKYDRAKEVMDDIEKEYNMQCQLYPGYSRRELRSKARRMVMAMRKNRRE